MPTDFDTFTESHTDWLDTCDDKIVAEIEQMPELSTLTDQRISEIKSEKLIEHFKVKFPNVPSEVFDKCVHWNHPLCDRCRAYNDHVSLLLHASENLFHVLIEKGLIKGNNA